MGEGSGSPEEWAAALREARIYEHLQRVRRSGAWQLAVVMGVWAVYALDAVLLFSLHAFDVAAVFLVLVLVGVWVWLLIALVRTPLWWRTVFSRNWTNSWTGEPFRWRDLGKRWGAAFALSTLLFVAAIWMSFRDPTGNWFGVLIASGFMVAGSTGRDRPMFWVGAIGALSCGVVIFFGHGNTGLVESGMLAGMFLALGVIRVLAPKRWLLP